jgi:hypothetical protein
MATPAGMQSMTAFTNHMASVNSTSHHPQPQPPQLFPSQSHNSPPPYGMNKRKREERQTQYEAQNKAQSGKNVQQPSKKPPRAKCKAAPEVPNFGFTLPPAPGSRPSASSKPVVKPSQQKSKVNLGLTHGGDLHQSSDEEDVDEEAAFAENYKVEGVMFEHDGESISLQTQAEVAAWIKDRRRQFPTQRRIMQKAEEAAAKRASELDFLRKIKGKGATRNEGTQASQAKDNKRKKKPAARPKPALERLHSKPQESIAKNGTPSELEPKPHALDLGLGYASDTDPASNESSHLSDSSVVSTSSESSDESDSDADHSDAPPETQSVKVPIARVVVPPPPTLRQPKQKKSEVCPQWQKKGTCKFGRHCKNSHPKESEAKRVGLYERMVEQELEKADRLALDAIKYLGRNGFLG